MSEKKITQEHYHAAVDAANKLGWSRTLDDRSRGEQYADEILKAAGITVEPPPILPGVSEFKGDE